MTSVDYQIFESEPPTVFPPDPFEISYFFTGVVFDDVACLNQNIDLPYVLHVRVGLEE